MSAAAFEQATQDVLKLTKQPGYEEQLKLYGLFKIAKGLDITAATAPSFYERKEKMKRQAWQDLVDKGTTQEEAQQQYVELVEELKSKYA